MTARFLQEGSKIVRLRGRLVRKHEVQLGRFFVEDGRKKQTCADDCLFSSVEYGAFRFNDSWYFKDPKEGVLALKPNAPFGYPQRAVDYFVFKDDTRVGVLKVEDRGPA